jgi:hypothetical protein
MGERREPNVALARLTHMRTRTLASLIALAVAAPAAHAATSGAQPSIAHPSGATDVVLRVTVDGGFVPVQTSLATLPTFTLYGDGRVVVPGAQIQISPAPALVTLAARRLSERQVQTVLRRATQSGLLARGPIDYGDMGAIGVSDMPTTTVALHAAGRTLERAAYALAVTPNGGRLSHAQARARLLLARFIAALPARPASSYSPHGYAVFVAPAQAAIDVARSWPLHSDLATAGAPVSSGTGYRCVTVVGRDADRLRAALRRANAESQWSSGGRRYTLIPRPLLPDERGCASLA